MSDIFISYAREDRPRAQALAAALETQGWSVWWDPIIPAGQTFRKVIREEIGKARCMVVIWSRESVESNWVLDEASLGQKRGILVPVRIDDAEPPLGFGEVHAADLTNWGGDSSAPVFRALVRDIAAHGGLSATPGVAKAEPPEEARGAPVARRDKPTEEPHAPAPGAIAEKPAQEERQLVTEWALPARLGRIPRRWVVAGASLAVLLCAVFVTYDLWPGKTPRPTDRQPQASSPTQPPGTSTNRNDGLSYVHIPAGEFQMGAAPGDGEADADEKPRHPVRITKGFWMSETPVTVAEYKRFTRSLPPPPDFNPGWSKDDHPIVRVTWDEAKVYCEWAGGRLPTEAEWEYAARGGKDGLKYPWGNEITSENANYGGSKWKGTSPVRSYPANAWGLYDMAGNVWEWVADWYGEKYYATLPSDKPAEDPRGPQSGEVRVLRGGSFGDVSRILRASLRNWYAPGNRSDVIGFRCVREVVP